MNETINFFQKGLWMVVTLSAPPLIVATIFGVVVSLVQAITSIQDQTLPYVIKLIVVSVSLALMGRWFGNELLQMLNAAFSLIPNVGR